MKQDKKVIEVIVSDDLIVDRIVRVLQDERAIFRYSKELSKTIPTDCNTAFVIVTGDNIVDCIGLAQFIAPEIDGLLYCGPNHPNEKACVGAKIARVKQDYTIIVKRSTARIQADDSNPMELHVQVIQAAQAV